MTQPPDMSPHNGGEYQPKSNRGLYWGVAAVVVILAIVGLVTYDTAKNNNEAKDKAHQLVQKFEKAGLTAPADINIITETFGTDGGAVCENPATALGKAVLNDVLVNGASFVGQRPVIVDRDILLGELLILQTYCPDKLKPYQDKILQLKTADVVNE
jgi:hypothetical protein